MTDTATKKLFGTDGIRGLANTPPLDPETLVELGAVIGSLVREQSGDTAGVLLAHDGRLSAEMIRAALTAGLLSQGLGTFDAGLCTTPALAHETRLGGFAAGIMISASHNPAGDNGIKLFGGDGAKIADEFEAEVEANMHAQPLERPHRQPGRGRRLDLGAARYRAFLTDAFEDLDLAGTRMFIDCANGAGSQLAPDALESFGAEVVRCNNTPDGVNINKGCGALYPDQVAARVAAEGCRLGLCLDGDGDRAIFIDELGNVVHGDAVLTLLGLEWKRTGKLDGDAVAVTVMSNLGLKKRLAKDGVSVVETPVGDRSVMAAMREHGICLGGENSGHVLFGEEHHYAGDGLYTGLRLLGVMNDTGATLSELAACFEPFPQLLVNVPVRNKPKLMSLPLVVQAVKESEVELAGDGRVVLRYSGTENLCRVMVEAPTDDVVQRLVNRIVVAVKQSLGA